MNYIFNIVMLIYFAGLTSYASEQLTNSKSMNPKACLNGSGSTNLLFTLEFLLCPFHPKA